MSQIHVSVFGSSQSRPGDPDYEEAVRLGGLLADHGCAVINGGYGGLMEAVSAGAAAGGGRVIGVTAPAVFPGRSSANPYLTDERRAPDLVSRIGMMLDLSDAAITLPGSIGTLTELLMTWNVNYVASFSGKDPIPLITVGPQWAELVPLLTERVSTNGALVTCLDTVEAAVDHLVKRLT
jgi:hypothetical protein